MKVRPFCLLVLFIGLLGSSVSSQTENRRCLLTIYFDTPAQTDGKIYFLVFNDAKTFGKEKEAYNSAIVDPSQVAITLPYGTYAITCFQSTDGDGVLKTNFMGIPKEPVGASNNPTLMGTPKWSSTSFVVNRPQQSIRITLKKLF